MARRVDHHYDGFRSFVTTGTAARRDTTIAEEDAASSSTISALPEVLDGDKLANEASYDLAMEKYRRALDVFRSMGDSAFTDPLLRKSARVLSARGDVDQSREIFEHLVDDTDEKTNATYLWHLNQSARFFLSGVQEPERALDVLDRIDERDPGTDANRDVHFLRRHSNVLRGVSQSLLGLDKEATETFAQLRNAGASKFDEEDNDDALLAVIVDANYAIHAWSTGRSEVAERVWKAIDEFLEVRQEAFENSPCGAAQKLVASRAISTFGHFLNEMGRLDEAESVLRRALNLQTSSRQRLVESDVDGDAPDAPVSRASMSLRLDLLIAQTLSLLGRTYHGLEKAVTAEGLLRTATDDMKALRPRMQPLDQLRYATSLEIYGNLLNDWEKREGEASKMFELSESVLESSSLSTSLASPGAGREHFVIGGWGFATALRSEDIALW